MPCPAAFVDFGTHLPIIDTLPCPISGTTFLWRHEDDVVEMAETAADVDGLRHLVGISDA